MHLLVLSAFRLDYYGILIAGLVSLNAPFGAQCFPTLSEFCLLWSLLSLNAPFGAQCFPTADRLVRDDNTLRVSMHLLVLSAFRLN